MAIRRFPRTATGQLPRSEMDRLLTVVENLCQIGTDKPSTLFVRQDARGVTRLDLSTAIIDELIGGSLTVEEADLAPSISGVTTIRFNQVTGFVVTDLSPVALVEMQSASTTLRGVVNTVAQTFGGPKGVEHDAGASAGRITFAVRGDTDLNDKESIISFGGVPEGIVGSSGNEYSYLRNIVEPSLGTQTLSVVCPTVGGSRSVSVVMGALSQHFQLAASNAFGSLDRPGISIYDGAASPGGEFKTGVTGIGGAGDRFISGICVWAAGSEGGGYTGVGGDGGVFDDAGSPSEGGGGGGTVGPFPPPPGGVEPPDNPLWWRPNFPRVAGAIGAWSNFR